MRYVPIIFLGKRPAANQLPHADNLLALMRTLKYFQDWNIPVVLQIAAPGSHKNVAESDLVSNPSHIGVRFTQMAQSEVP